MSLFSKLATRASYARTNADMLVNDPDGFPSDFPPIWWNGLDTGGGAYPIGPNGPYGTGAAAALPAVTRATSLICGPLTAAPFRVLEQGFAGQPVARPRWVTDPMLLRADARFPLDELDLSPAVTKLPRSLFWTEWLRSAIWWGLGAFISVEDTNGNPLAGSLKPLAASALSTETWADGLHWVLGSEGERVVFDRDGYVDLGPIRYRVTVLRNPHSPVDAAGMSLGVFALCPQAFALAGQVETYASGQFRSGIPAGYLKVAAPQLTPGKAADLKQRWLAAHGGDRRSIAVLNATTEFHPLSLSPVDAALAEVKRLNIADVAMAFGLDPMTLGAGLNNSATYTNLRDAWANHKDFGLAPWIAAVEDTLSALMPGSQGVKVNLDGFANPPAKERVETGAAAVAAGLISVDEWRAAEGFPPMDTVPVEEPEPTPAEEPTAEPEEPAEEPVEEPAL